MNNTQSQRSQDMHGHALAQYRLLIVCTGNSARSIMAEALLNHLGKPYFQAASAGSQPTGRVHPQALAALARHSIDTHGLHSKSTECFLNDAAQHFDFVITVCDHAATLCPSFPGHPRVVHWGLPDPAKHQDAVEIQAAFETCIVELKRCITQLVALQSSQPQHQQIFTQLVQLGIHLKEALINSK